MQKQRKSIPVIVIILSLLFLFCGNKIAAAHSTSIVVQGRDSEMNDQVFAQVLKVNSITPDPSDETRSIVKFTAKIKNSQASGQVVSATQFSYKSNATMPPAVSVNDKVVLGRLSSDSGTEWAFENYERIDQIVILSIVLMLFILLFGGRKGVNTILALVFTCISIFYVFIPLIMSGFNIYLCTVIICIYVISVTFSLTGGMNQKSLAAALGCISGVVVSGGVYELMEHTMKLTGYYNDQSSRLVDMFSNHPINLRAIVFAMVTIGALGATMDIAMSISSSLEEIKSGKSKVSRSALIKSGLNIGKDIMGTMMNTLILAYIGSSLVMVIIYNASGYPLSQLLNQEEIIIEFLQSLAGSLGMLLTIPLTTFISALILQSPEKPASPANLNRNRLETGNPIRQVR